MRIEFDLKSQKPNEYLYMKKDASGVERTYLTGVSSGSLYIDAHNEVMSEKCVRGFQQQAEEKTIYLLHPHTEDLLSNHIGMLISELSYINDNKEWITTFRVWDESDSKLGIPNANIQKAIDFRNQYMGKGVYKKRTAIKQLSVQGLFNEETDLLIDPSGIRIIDWVELDGVSVIPKGAYPQDNFTVAQKILKQYDKKTTSIKTNSIKTNSMKSKLKKSENTEDYYINEWKIEDAYNETKQEILENTTLSEEQKKEKLITLLEEYKELLIKNFELINYNLEKGEEVMKKTKSINEEIDALTESDEPEVINKEEESQEDNTSETSVITMTPEMLEEFVEKAIAKYKESEASVMKSEDESVEKMEDVGKSDDDGLYDKEPTYLKGKSEDVEKSEGEEDIEKSEDEDIEKVAKKLGLNKHQKMELYKQKELAKLPKYIISEINKTNKTVDVLQKSIVELRKQNAFLMAGQEAIFESFSNEKPEIVNQVKKAFVPKDGVDDKIKQLSKKDETVEKSNTSFDKIRTALIGAYNA